MKGFSNNINLSDLLPIPNSPFPMDTTKEKTSTTQQISAINTKNTATHDDFSHGIEDEDVDGEVFGVILSRSCSGHSNAFQKFRQDKQDTTTRTAALNSAVKRVLSMRRYPSVSSEKYCRIHDQCGTPGPPNDDGGGWGDESSITQSEDMKMKKKKKKKHKSGKMLEACKRLVGLQW